MKTKKTVCKLLGVIMFIAFLPVWQTGALAAGGSLAVVSYSPSSLGVDDINTEQMNGNTAGNIINDGEYAQSGGWVYFTNWNLSNPKDRQSWGYLHKMKADGSSLQKVADVRCKYINVAGDWIYFTHNYYGDYMLYKMKTDGTGLQKINDVDKNVKYVTVAGDWIYYKNESYGDMKLYKIKTDGTERQMVCKDAVNYISVAGDWIYYQNASDGFNLYRVKTDGTERQKLYDRSYCGWINAVDGWVYFTVNDISESPDDGIYRMRPDGTGIEKLCDDGAKYMNVSGEWIFYEKYISGTYKGFYKIRTDGTDRQLFSQDHDDVRYIYTADGWVYYRYYYEADWTMGKTSDIYKVKFDGTGRERIYKSSPGQAG